MPQVTAQITTTLAADYLPNCVGAEETSPQLYTEIQHHLHSFLPCSLQLPPHLITAGISCVDLRVAL